VPLRWFVSSVAVGKGQFVYKRGFLGDEMFIIAEGEVRPVCFAGSVSVRSRLCYESAPGPCIPSWLLCS
jgi:hypothetical protein